MTVSRWTDGGAPADGSHRRNRGTRVPRAPGSPHLPRKRRAEGPGRTVQPHATRGHVPPPRGRSAQASSPRLDGNPGAAVAVGGEGSSHGALYWAPHGKEPFTYDHRGRYRDRRPRRSRRSTHLKPQGQRAWRGRKSGEETPGTASAAPGEETPGQEAPRPPPWSFRNRAPPIGAIRRGWRPNGRTTAAKASSDRPFTGPPPGGESHGEARAALCRVPVRASTPPRGTEASELAPQGVINP